MIGKALLDVLAILGINGLGFLVLGVFYWLAGLKKASNANEGL